MARMVRYSNSNPLTQESGSLEDLLRASIEDWLTDPKNKVIKVIFMKILEQTSTQLTVQHKYSIIWFLIGVPILYGSGLIALGISLRGIQENPDFFLVSIGLLFFIVAFFLLAFSSLVVTSSFDKNLSKITVKEQKIFNINIREYSLSEISDVRIEASNALSYKLIGVLRSGKRLTLSFPTTERSLEEPIAQIRSFLGYY